MIGRTLGHYRIVEPLGAGGMGEVYRAHDERLDRDVALKVLPEGALSDEEARKRFRKEANALSRLSHPHIATLHDFDSQDGTDFIVMELVSGPSLADELKAGPLEEKRIVTLGSQLARGLQAAHQQGIVHRDLKPSNLQLTPDGLLKILDFGLARLVPKDPVAGDETAPTQTAVGKVAGTLAYMSPEQLRGRGVDARTDLYAAGAVLYEMATGRRLFSKPSTAELTDAILHEEPAPPRAVNPRVSPGLESVILKALDKDPELRSQTAKDLLVDLERLAASSTTGVASRPRGGRLARRRWWRWALAAGAALGLALADAFLLEPAAVPRVKSFSPIVRNLGWNPWRMMPPVGHGLVTDGHRIYFIDNPGHALRQVAATGGDTLEIPIPTAADPLDYSEEHSALLLRDGPGRLWALPLPAGTPRPLGDVEVGRIGSGAWSPDGQRLAFTRGTALHLANGDGLEPRLLVDLETRLDGLVWSPDGRHIRVGAFDPGGDGGEPWIVEIDVEHPDRPAKRIARGSFTAGWPPGTWTRDGRFFVFAGGDPTGIRPRLLVRPEAGLDLPWRSGEPVDLLSSPDLWACPTASPLDDRLFVVNRRLQGALRRFDHSRGAWTSAFRHLGSAEQVDFSRDGQWAVWVSYPEETLWRARVDGTDKLALTQRRQFTRVVMPRWSPDGRSIAFTASPGSGPERPFVISAEGGVPDLLPSREDERALDVCWLADGEDLLFGYRDAALGIQKVTLATKTVTTLLGSEGLTTPKCGRGGVLLAGDWKDGFGITHILDPESGRWTRLPIGPTDLNYASFSRDGRFVYGLGEGFGTGVAVHRLELATRKLSVVTHLEEYPLIGVVGNWFGLAPDDSPLYLAERSGWDLYALELEMP